MRRIIHKRSIQKAAVLLMALVMSFSASISVLAASDDRVTAEIKFSREISGTESTGEKFTFRLEAEDENTPVPEQQDITVSGAGDTAFEIEYTEPGVYRYTLAQIAGNSTGWTYDDSMYTVEVYVLRDSTLENPESLVIMYNDKGEKTDAVFTNSYKTETKTEPGQDTPTKTADTTDAGKSSAAKTGDQTDMTLWLLLILGAAAAGLYFGSRRISQ